ncbi:hypothetical protein [Verrucomicrobium sp. BvORR106]|uniref:hypothetical protein n=1 Tax=Verrucomicrobium sp. BvORR106 TaxID=1403819 RepID=UPI0005713808|nr:hypothetical protein [Verrucomicrobium sp. BvORR106]
MAAVPDYYTGFTQVEVERILAVQKKELEKALQAYSENGTSVTKRALDAVNLIIAGCQKALKKFDPETYGARRVRSGFVCP